MNIANNFQTIEQITNQYLSESTKVVKKPQEKSFEDVLNITFSKHAAMRLESRNIDLTGDQLERLTRGADKARENGIKDSLLLMDDLAFIVNTKNNTVVTAMSGADSKDKVYTNIDGAVIV